jgi:hypothetical protein
LKNTLLIEIHRKSFECLLSRGIFLLLLKFFYYIVFVNKHLACWLWLEVSN